MLDNNDEKYRRMVSSKRYQEKHIVISISRENYNKLRYLGHAGDSFNDVMDKILAKYKVKKGTLDND